MSDWFEVRELSRGIWEITETGHVTFWLVVGSDRAALIDTGCGFVPLRPMVERLCEVPVLVVNSHNHLDHVGGNAEFSEIAIHPLGADGLQQEFPAEMLAAYRRYSEEMVGSLPPTPSWTVASITCCQRAMRRSRFPTTGTSSPAWRPRSATSEVPRAPG